jgi:hypothetical protein
MANQAREERNRAFVAESKARRQREEQGRFDREVSPWLRPQERVRGVVEFRLDEFTPRCAPRRLRAAKPVPPQGWDDSPGYRLIRTLWWGTLGLLVTAYMVIRRPIHGFPFRGGWSSQAGQFLLMVLRGPSRHRLYENDEACLVFTDHRVLVLHRQSAEFLGELALSQLVVGEPKERPFRQAERVDLSFTDGSLLALDAGLSNKSKLLRDLLAGRA